MNVQRDRRDFERRVLLLARPYELRIEMRIVIIRRLGGRGCPPLTWDRGHRSYILISLMCRQRRVGFGGDQSRRGIIHAVLVLVLVLLDLPLTVSFACLSPQHSPPLKLLRLIYDEDRMLAIFSGAG